MNRFLKQIVSIILLVSLLLGAVESVHADEGTSVKERKEFNSLVDFESFGLTDEQLSALDLMNHLTIVMYEINDSQINRMYLEKTFTSIINYLNVSKIDLHTKQQISQASSYTLAKYSGSFFPSSQISN